MKQRIRKRQIQSIAIMNISISIQCWALVFCSPILFRYFNHSSPLYFSQKIVLSFYFYCWNQTQQKSRFVLQETSWQSLTSSWLFIGSKRFGPGFFRVFFPTCRRSSLAFWPLKTLPPSLFPLPPPPFPLPPSSSSLPPSSSSLPPSSSSLPPSSSSLPPSPPRSPAC